MSTLLLLLLACGGNKEELAAEPDGINSTGETPDATDSETSFTAADAALELSESGAFLAPGSQIVPGIARAMDSVTLNGTGVSVTGGTFSHSASLDVGINPLDLVGTDIDGGPHRDFGAVLAGDYAAPDGPVYDAVQVHLSQPALDDLSVVAGALIDPSLLNPSLQALNPLVDSPEAYVELGDIRFDDPEITLTATADGLQMALVLPNFVLPIEATIPDALPFGIDLDLNPDLEADAIVLYANVDLSTDGNGKLEVQLSDVEAELQGFDLDTGLLELVDWLFIDDDDIAEVIETQVANLGPGLGDAIGGMLAGLDLKTELDLLGTPLTIWPAFDDASTDADGVYLSLAIAVDVDAPGPAVPGHLDFPAPAARVGNNTLLQVSDGFMNRALFEVWSSGALDLELPLDTPETSTILVLFGGDGEGSLGLEMGLPPVWIERNGESRVQLGDTIMTIKTPGGKYGDEIQLKMFLDAAAAVELGADSAGVVLSDAQVVLVPTGISAGDEDIAEFAEGLQTAFGIAIGMINGMLQFPLTDLLGPDTQLPEIALERDPSGTGVSLDLDLGALDLVTLLLGPQPPETVIVPGTATVIDDDMELTYDNDDAWICERNDVETTGNDGIWYVEDRAELIVHGTGHVIWAMDGADIVLESGGNEVWAHVDANVEDNDPYLTNVVTWLDPLTLDTSAAPYPGCD